MKTLEYILPLFLIVTLSSCEKELDYKDLDYQPQIVLNGLIYQDSIIRLNAATTKSILEVSSSFPFLDEAVIRLYENDVFVENLIYDSLGWYHSSIKTKNNTNYRIEATYGNIETAIAKFDFKNLGDFQVTNINLFHLKDTSITVNATIDTTYFLSSYVLEFEMVYTDNEKEENYYDFGITGSFYDISSWSTNTGTSGYTDSISIDKTSTLHLHFRDYEDNKKYNTANSSTFNGYEKNHYISDNIFNGEEVSLGLVAYFNTDTLKPVEIILYSIPYDYVHFHNTGYSYISNDGNPFSQPINIHSNVENGLGIVCGVSCTKQTIDLSELPAKQ